MARALAFLIRPHVLVMLALFVGAAVAGLLILPGEVERVAMLERDGQNERARQMLEQREAAGRSTQRSLYQLEQLYGHFGDLPKARATLERLAAARPRDIVLQRRLARYYRDTQDMDAYLATLSRLVARRYSEPICRELIAQLRYVGQFARERETIERCRLRGYRRVEDLVRLAELEAADGDGKRAASLMRALDDANRLATPEARLSLASMLLDTDEAAELERRAVAWIVDQADGAVALPLIDLLARRGREDTGIEIARKAGKPGDALSLTVAELMVARDQTTAAADYLRGWLGQAKDLDDELAGRAVAIALDAEQPELAMDVARRHGLKRLPEAQVVAIAEALGAQGKPGASEVVRDALSADTLVAHPLLAAMVELNRGEAAATRELLAKVPTDGLAAWRLALWARLMRETGRGAIAAARLREAGVDQRAARTRSVLRRRSARLLRQRRVRPRPGVELVTSSITDQATGLKKPRSSSRAQAKLKRLKSVRALTARRKPVRKGAPRPSPVARPSPVVER